MNASINSLIAQLGAQNPIEQTHAVLALMAQATPDPITLDQWIRAIAKKVGTSIKAVRQNYEITLKNLNIIPPDLGLFIATEMLNTKYGKGIYLKQTPDGFFYSYAGSHWAKTTEAKIRSELQEIAIPYKGMTDKTLLSLVSDALGSLKDYLGSNQDVLALTEEPLPVINCLNGEVWFKSDGAIELRSHKPESNLLYCLPYNYDPKAACPTFDNALLEIFDKAEDPKELCRHIYEMIGYAIQPKRPIPCFWMFIGHGANGKTTLLETVNRLIGPDFLYNVDMSGFGKDKFNISQLPGKLVMIDDDLKMDTVLPDGLLKKISESKKMSARQPYGKQSFTFINSAMPIMAGNHYPLCHDLSPGMLRRAMIVPFRRQFLPSEQDKGKFEHIWEHEMSGILNRAIDGYKRVTKRARFDPPQECIEARQDFLAHGNPLFCFLTERLEEDEQSRILLPEFRQAFEAWCKEQNIAKPSVANKTLKRRLESLKYDIGLYNGYASIKGYRLKTIMTAL